MEYVKICIYTYFNIPLFDYIIYIIYIYIYIYIYNVASHGTPSTLSVLLLRYQHHLQPFWAILGRRASDMACQKHVILFANITSLNDAVMSYVTLWCHTCIGHVTIYYKRATNALVGGSCLLFVCSTLSPETRMWLVSNTCRS